MKIKFIAFFIATILSTNLFAGSMTANDVYTLCSDNRPYIQDICNAYLNGFIEGIALENAYNFKINYPISPITLRRLFIHQIKKHPENGDEEFGIIMSSALLKAGKLIKPNA